MSVTSPLLVEVPERLETERLVLRSVRRGDGAAACAAVRHTFESLRPWMPWAQDEPSVDAQEAYCRRQEALFILREELNWFVYERGAEGSEGPVLGAVGLHHIDWSLRRFEMGWWRRHGLEHLGVAHEAGSAVVRLVFERLGARRLEVRTDAGNAASRRLAERLGFALEGVLRLDSATPGGVPRDTCVYARVLDAQASASVGSGPGG